MTDSITSKFHALVMDVRQCRLCARMDHSERIFGPGSGSPDAPIMFVGEAPGRLGADSSAIPFHGDKAGDNFERLISQVGLTRYEIFVTNAVLCNPRDERGNNATPTAREIRNCSGFLAAQIDLVQPRLIVTLGAKALLALSQLESHSIALSSGVRKAWPWRGVKLVPLYHPGQRAMIHRSYANQLSDYQFVAETWHRLNQRKRYPHNSPTKEASANIVRAILGAAERLSYFALHKIFYLVELEHVQRTGNRLSNAYVVRQKDGPYVTDLHLLRLRGAMPELLVTRTADSIYLALGREQQSTLFRDVDRTPEANSFVSEVVRPLVHLSNAQLKQKVYMTRPMREILRREITKHELLYNVPIDFQLNSQSNPNL